MKGFMSFLLALVLMLQYVSMPVLAQEVDDGINERFSPPTLQEERNVHRSAVLEGTSLDESEYEDITDAFIDPNFLAVVQAAIGDSSGTIYLHQVEQIDRIDVRDRNIESLAGIEYFTCLTYLSCASNQLTALDISHNPALKWLYCYDNQLTALDVSNNFALETLSCANNQMTALDVSNNLALKRLSCYNNQLTALDVSNNPALEWLYCYNNSLTVLDVSHNPALKWLSCDNNQLMALDVSHTLALEWLYCENNKLTVLDVSNSVNLEYFHCYNNQLTVLDVSNNPALKWLDCYNNQLTVLDVLHNPAVELLYCDNNQLTALDVSNNLLLTDLRCEYNQLTLLGLSSNLGLTSLSCEYNQLTALDISSNPKLTFLSCYNNYMSQEPDLSIPGWQNLLILDYFPQYDTQTEITINVAASLGGTVTGGGSYAFGDTVTLTAIPSEGHQFDGWYENETKRPNVEAVYRFTAITDRHLIAQFTKKTEPPVPTAPTFDGATWHIPTFTETNVELSLPGWTVDKVYIDNEHRHSLTWQRGDATIILSSSASPFSAIVRLAHTSQGKVRYVGIEKPVSISEGTAFDGKTWRIPASYTAEEAILTLNDSRITNVWCDVEDVYTLGTNFIRIAPTTDAFSAIVKLVDTNGKTHYIGIERDAVR